MERFLYGLLYLISVPLCIFYVFIDLIDKKLLKKRRRYIFFQEVFLLAVGIYIVYEKSDTHWIIPAVIVTEIILFFLYDAIRKCFRYIFKGIKFLLFPFYYVIHPRDIKKMNRRVYREATGEDLNNDEWDPWNVIDPKIEQSEFKKVNSNSLFEKDMEKVRTILLADHISIKNALYVFGFNKIGDVTIDDLKIRYHFLAKRYHSDNTKEDESIMKGINVAHEKLLNFAKK